MDQTSIYREVSRHLPITSLAILGDISGFIRVYLLL